MTTFAAKYEGTCPACLQAINVGDPAQFKTDGNGDRRVVHESCATRIIIVNGDSFARAASKRGLPAMIAVLRNALGRLQQGSELSAEDATVVASIRASLDAGQYIEPSDSPISSLTEVHDSFIAGMFQFADSDPVDAAESAHGAITGIAYATTDPNLARQIINGAYTDLQNLVTAARQQEGR